MEFLGVQYGNINDLPKVINNKSKAILFADDTSIIISNPNAINLKKYIINIFEQMNVWFTSTFFIINFDKTHYLQFRTKNSSPMDTKIINTSITQFLGIVIYTTYS
jgi:hypothetical protein